MTTPLLWVIVAYASGALPLSVWLGRLALRTDIRQVGDGNPGAANVWRAGGKWWGGLAILLDYLKGALPVGLAHFGAGLEGCALSAVALAPILGHATSPFLRFRGGKALAVSFGSWTGLTLWQGPTVLGLAFAFWLALLAADAWAVVLGMLTLLLFLLGTQATPPLLGVWTGNMTIFVWKHWSEFRQKPDLKKGILRPLFRK